MTGQLKDKVALVTGAARGIGRATAEALAAEGARPVLVDRDGAVAEVAREIGGAAHLCDLTDTEQLEAVVSEVSRYHGPIDILVNNAGLARHNRIEDVSTEEIDLMWAVNARAVMVLSRDAFRHMAGRGGQIVNVVSTAGLRGGPGEAVYSATKFAVRGFSESLAEEGRVRGIRVHAVFPAGVDTEFWTDATAAGPGVDPTDRFLAPADVAAAIVHALSRPSHMHVPELVLRAVGDADLAGIEAKLEWFRS
ncbi:MAG: SDR family oxidoreductase [Acidimicrobiales bacterium]